LTVVAKRNDCLFESGKLTGAWAEYKMRDGIHPETFGTHMSIQDKSKKRANIFLSPVRSVRALWTD
jgi:hypothetical protein